MPDKEITFSYTPTADDKLVYTLYYASSSDFIRENRDRQRIMIFILLISIAVIVELSATSVFEHTIAAAVSVYAIIVGLLYKRIAAKTYYRRYKQANDEQYRDAKIRETRFVIDIDNIRVQDEISEGQIKTVAIKKITEIGQYLFIYLDTKQAFYIPKDRINNAAELSAFLKVLATHLNISYEEDLNWKWK